MMSDSLEKCWYSPPKMGVEESGISALQQLQLFERIFTLIGCISEPEPLPSTSKTLSDLIVKDKKMYYWKVARTLIQRRESFMTEFDKLIKSLNDITKKVKECLEEQEREITRALRAVGVQKMAAWNAQLKICTTNICQLNSIQNSSVGKEYNLEDILLDVGLIDDGVLDLECQDVTNLQKKIESLVRITNSRGDSGLQCIAPKFSFGGYGEEPGEFCRPWGVVSDAIGRILVCDRSNHRVQIFDESGQFLQQFGKEGSGPGQFNRPTGIATDENFRIIVADKDNHRIQIFTFSGEFLLKFGSQGSRPGQFMYPWDVTVNKNSEIAVSDSKNQRIQLFDKHGKFLAIFNPKKMGVGSPRAGAAILDSPRGLSFQPDGCLLVTDFNKHRVLRISKTFDEYVIFGSEGPKTGQFFRPQGISCDNTGRFVVADCKNYRVQVFDKDGKFLQSFGTQGAELGQSDTFQGICIHPNRSIIVVDFSNHRIQVF